MSSLLLIIIVVVLMVLVGGVLLVVMVASASSRKSSYQQMGYAPPADFGAPAMGHTPYPAAIGQLSPAALAEVRALLVRGRKIQAIKVVREDTRMGLKDAKDYVEALEASGRAPAGFSDAPLPEGQPGGGRLSERARAFKAAGDRDSAIALVRAETGMNRSEAERFLDALD